MGKKIGFTYDLKTDYKPSKDEPVDNYAELDREETISDVVSVLESAGHKVTRIGNCRKLLERIDEVKKLDLVLNICEGVGGRNRESQVPMVLEFFGIPFVGSDALTLGLTLDKAMAKKVMLAEGVATPKFFLADAKTDFQNLDSMKFPFFVKPCHEGSSKGISENSIVNDRQELARQVRQIAGLYKQPVLVEEFIRGSEFTVLVIGNAEPKALAPVQVQIAGNLEAGELVYTSRRLEGDDIVYVCPPKTGNGLVKGLKAAAVRAYRALGCRDFGRVDFRVDERDNVFALEINPLPALTRADVFPLIAKAEGMTYNALILKIIDEALERLKA